jgi:hypothetical protein
VGDRPGRAVPNDLIATINDFDRAEVEAAADKWLQENGG